ncbi:MAG: hypothetical protein LBI18_02325, partial [Planctomycetaceae bacterium]|nr:hypothetical protein [Planctomycetaceae bacterium]
INNENVDNINSVVGNTEKETINHEIINSVILQICRKDNFEQLDKIIDTHKIEEPEPQQEAPQHSQRKSQRKFR